MGLETAQFGKKIFLSISEGKVTRNNDAGGKDHFTAVTGILTGISFREGEAAKYGTELHLHLSDNGEAFTLQMRLVSGYATAFMKAIENADLTKPITLAPWYSVKNDQKKSGMKLIQGGVELPWKYTRDHMHGCPEVMEVDNGDGSKSYNKGAQLKFLRTMLERDIAPKLRNNASNVQAMTASAGNQEHVSNDETDDMPF